METTDISTACDPFDYEHLCARPLRDFLTVDANYAFGKKHLKYLRPFLKVIRDRNISGNPKTQARINAVFKKHLSKPII